MPGKSGLEVISDLRSVAQDEIAFIVITGHGGFDEAVEALRLGASDFLMKPFSSDQLEGAIRKCMESLCNSESRIQARLFLEAEVKEKTVRIAALAREVDSARIEALETLAIAAEHRDNDTGEHIRRIGAYAEILALGLGWSERAARQIRMAATLHDVGKIGVPDNILMKPGRLSDAEIVIMQTHTIIGHKIVSPSNDGIMKVAASIAHCHHEQWNGGGYPRRLSGEDIPIEARITTICDVYDALRSPRPYKPALDHRTAVKIIQEGDGRTRPDQFDPAILAVFAAKADLLAEAYAKRPDFEMIAGEGNNHLSRDMRSMDAAIFDAGGKANAVR
jgi:putative two-component system response regulator